MRTFRTSITAILIIVSIGLISCPGYAVDQDSARQSMSRVAVNPYFPLAVGNSWTYRCSVEGADYSKKSMTITSSTVHNGRLLFRSEMRVQGDPKPLVTYIGVNLDGSVVTYLDPGESGKVLMTAAPKVGDHIGEDLVGGFEKVKRTKVFPTTELVRVENFSIDDSKTESKRMSWLGRWYGRGIGPVDEADGLGGECLLSKYHLQPAK